jgi:putative hydrolase of the HAD superfamily
MTYKAVIFDLDDTLLVEVASAEAAFIDTCRLAQDKYGLDPHEFHTVLRQKAKKLWYDASPAREYCVRVSVSHWEGLWARYEGDDPELKILQDWAPTYREQSWSQALAAFNIDDPQFAVQLGEAFPEYRRQRHQVYTEVEPVLQSLGKTHKLGLITNGLPCLQREKIAGSGLGHYFDATVISGDVGKAKPDPMIFQTLLEKLDTQPDQTLMVGNSVAGDIGGAQGVGMKAILIDRGDIHGSDDSIRPDGIIESLTELTKYLI